jgi:hypothetical protein
VELAGYFKGLLGRIEPGDAHVKDAKRAHETLRKRLREDDDVGEAHEDTFLSGSYARHTAIKDIKDVDVICILSVDKDETEPTVLLRWLEGAILKYYDEIRLQGRSISITTSGDFLLDLVPATPQSSANGPLWIPDREAKTWVATHPKGQIQFASERNTSTDGFYVQTVKIMKHWRDRLPNSAAQPKSYVVEALAAHAMGASPPGSHAEAVVKVLNGIWNRYGSWVNSGRVPTIPDPGYPNVSVSKRWEAAEFDAYMAQVRPAARVAQQALDEEDEAKSNALWRRLFGGEFAPEG